MYYHTERKENSHVSSLTMAADKPYSKSDHRRSNKPVMEKRRRARINHCLNELKGLILEAMKKDPARHSKLEKADILEMTVKHLQLLQRQQMALAVATDPSVLGKFRTGFGECATEVSRYISRIEGVDPAIRQRLLNHMATCLAGINGMTAAAMAGLSPLHSMLGPFPGANVPFFPMVPQLSFPLGDVNNNSGNRFLSLLQPARDISSLVIPEAGTPLRLQPTAMFPSPPQATPAPSTATLSSAGKEGEASSAFKAVNRHPSPAPSPAHSDMTSSSGDVSFASDDEESEMTMTLPKTDFGSRFGIQRPTAHVAPVMTFQPSAASSSLKQSSSTAGSKGFEPTRTSSKEQEKTTSETQDSDRMWRPW